VVLVDDKIYYETLEILRGNKKLPAIFAELKDWLYNEYHITAYNFEFKEMEFNNPTHWYRLYILLSTRNDRNSMTKGYNYDEDKQTAIAGKLYELAKNHNMKSLNTYKGAFVAYCDFSEEMQTDYNRQAYKLIGKQMLKKYESLSVWAIVTNFSSLVVFYHNDFEVKANQLNGLSKQIKDEYYYTLHQLDEFNVFTYENFSVGYDSKENLDKNYDGNLYYYFK